VAFTTHPI